MDKNCTNKKCVILCNSSLLQYLGYLFVINGYSNNNEFGTDFLIFWEC